MCCIIPAYFYYVSSMSSGCVQMQMQKGFLQYPPIICNMVLIIAHQGQGRNNPGLRTSKNSKRTNVDAHSLLSLEAKADDSKFHVSIFTRS